MEENISKLKRIGQRGPDRKPRVFNPKSLLNLMQFQKPVSEVDLDINSGINWSKLGKILVVIMALVLLWRMYDQRKTKN